MSGPAFRAWALPPAVPPPKPPRTERVGAVVDVDDLEPDASWVEACCEALRSAGPALRRRPVRSVVEALGRVGARFLDPSDLLRERALRLLPAESGLSPAMAAAVLDGMACDWTSERLARAMAGGLGDALDGFTPGPEGPRRALGPSLCGQVVSGSVPGVGATALIRSLLVKGPTLVKPGRGDVVLPVLFAEALREEDEELARAVAVVHWPGGLVAPEDALLREADVVVVYGSDATVQQLRARTPAATRFVAYPHRIGVGVVAREALDADRAHRTASELAGAVAFFDQRGCVSPQVVFVERGGAVGPVAFAAELAAALASVEEHLPGGLLDPEEASVVQQIRASAELRAAAGEDVVVHHGGDASWTVVLGPGEGMVTSCSGRVVRLRPIADVLDVPTLVAPLGRRLQSVGLAGGGSRRAVLVEGLAEVGACRVAAFADLPFPPPWWRHDGRGGLDVLVRWVDLDA